MDRYPLFDFESDFVSSLRCIPMVVRFKLDACAIKLSLRQWSRFTYADREALRLAPCDTAEEIAEFRRQLIELVAARTGDQAKALTEALDLSWQDRGRVPHGITVFAASAGAPAPDDYEWAALTPLERFTLVKLSRDNHDNVNFVPALVEFGIIEAEASPPQASPIGRAALSPSN